MSRLSLLDATFLLVDSEVSPKHVGALQVFELPASADENFVARLYHRLREMPPSAPFDRKLKMHRFGLPEWVPEPEPDWDYHLRHMALPAPGAQNELADLVAGLHSKPLDRDRPLWRVYLIESLAGRRFAVYIKIHHAYGDGMTIGYWLNRWLATSARAGLRDALWSPPPPAGPAAPALFGSLPATLVPELYKLVTGQVKRALGLSASRMPVPFAAPRTPFNTQVTADRAFATLDLDLAAMKTLGRKHDATVNDVLLTVTDIALHRYLREHDRKTDQPLVAQMPISLRRDGDGLGGNQVTMALVELASGRTRSPLKRLERIHAACRDVKSEYRALSPEATTLYIAVLELLAQAGESLHLTDQMPPLGNVLVSNIPGPQRTVFLDGARLVGAYPVSTFAPGLVINLTAYSYAGRLCCGLLGAKQAIPDIDRLAELMDQALGELQCAGSET
jgi:WS/DGAT/MGAT family acyltransferase